MSLQIKLVAKLRRVLSFVCEYVVSGRSRVWRCAVICARSLLASSVRESLVGGCELVRQCAAAICSCHQAMLAAASLGSLGTCTSRCLLDSK